MSVGVLIVTHGRSSAALVQEAGFVLGQDLEGVYSMEFNHSYNLTTVPQIQAAIDQADSGDGVLILTDLMGASPANLLMEAMEEAHAVMVTGVNLAMLIRACNYRNLSLELLVPKAVEGGKRAVKIFQT